VRKIREEEREQLDLSSWTVAFNGAEPVRWDTLQRFTSTFASSGFRAESFYLCYGLAEATLMVTGDQKMAGACYQEDQRQGTGTESGCGPPRAC
jgi:acyl-CoA synthetase (AMP-forming)/AMP-acid ligase II